MNECETEKAVTALCSEIIENLVSFNQLVPLRDLFTVLRDCLAEKERLNLSLLTSINKRLSMLNQTDNIKRRTSISSDNDMMNMISEEEATILLRIVDNVFSQPVSFLSRPELAKTYLEVRLSDRDGILDVGSPLLLHVLPDE